MPLFLALLVGLVLGAGAVGTVWAAASLAGAGNSDADGAAACDVIGRIEPIRELSEFTLDTNRRVTAAQALADVSAKSDGRYRPLADALTEGARAVAGLDIAQVNDSLADARRICGDL
jgi:hypothetical protein